MARLSIEDGNLLLEKKSGSSKKSKKIKRKNLVPFDWSAEHESGSSSSAQNLGSSDRTSPNIAGDEEVVTPTASDNAAGDQEQIQDVKPRNEPSPKPVAEAEAIVPTPSVSSREIQEQIQDVEPGDEPSPEPVREAEATVPTPFDYSREVQEHVQRVESGDGTSPGISGKAEAKIGSASNSAPELQKQATVPGASNIDSELQKLPQAAEATPEFAGEAKATSPAEPELSSVTSKSTDYQSAETSFDDFATAAGSISSPNVQQNDALPYDSHSPTSRGQTGEDYAFQQDQEEQSADNLSSENMRPNAQNLRYGGYPAQPAPQHRNTPLGSGRLQNTSKLGNGTNWAFGAPANGAPGLPSVQPSQTSTGASSFAQRVGGSQPAAPLDLSEFPSLSGTSQPQYQNTSQAIWANQRVAQQTPVQRPQQSHQVSSQAQQQHQQNQQNQDQSQRGNDDIYSASSNLQSSLDDHRYGGQTGISQLPSNRQPQPTSVDEFPPLGRNGTDEGDSDRRNMMQNPAFGGFTNANSFSLPQDQVQSRQGLPSTSNSQANNTRSSSVVDRLTSPNGMGFGGSSTVRSPTESNRQGQSGMQDHERNNASTNQANTRNEHTMNALLTNFNDSQFPPQQQPPQGRQDYGTRTGDSSRSNHTPDRTPLSQLSATDEFGIQGFLNTINHENPDVSYLARGQDLTTLGLNLNSAEPLWPTFAGPFAEPGSRPMQPDFRLPECYTVDNIHGVKEKIPSFSDETLFWIFYTQTQDILQEFVAMELTSRNWRFHTELKMWLTKDLTLPEPVQLNMEKEQGSYVFFNQMAWEKVRVSNFELQYKLLAPSVPRQNVQ